MQQSNKKWLGLCVVLVGTFLTSLDFNIVNVSIPSIRAGLGASFSEVQLMIAGYGLAFSVALITGGRLGDIYGRKRLLTLGMMGFGLASGFCGLAHNPAMLIASRVLQGLTAAMMFPQVLSIIQVSFLPREKSLAFSLYGMTMGLGNICGNLLGGLLTELNFFGLTWRPIFLINLPVVLGAVLAARPLVRESKSPSASRLDIPGAGMISVALSLIVYPLSVGHEVHWPAWTFVSLGLGVLILFAFVLYEEKKSVRRQFPLMETSLFRQRQFSAGLVVALLFFCGLAAILLMLTVYMQLALGFSAMKTGMLFCPFGLSFLLASLASSKLAPKIGRSIVQWGVGLMALGVLWLLWRARVEGPDIELSRIVVGLFVYGAGQGLAQPPLVAMIVAGVDPRDAGSASGVLSTVQQISFAFGIAIIGTAFFTLAGSSPEPADYIRAFTAALWINVSLLVMTFLMVFRLEAHRLPAEISVLEMA